MTTTSPLPATARPLLGVLFALLGAGFFATKGIIIKLGLAHGIDPLTTLTWRMFVAVPLFTVFGILAYRRKRASWPAENGPLLDTPTILRTMGIGIVGYYVASYLDFAGLAYISAQLDRLILLTYPFMVVLFGAILFGRKITAPMIASLLISYFGIALIFFTDLSIEGDNVLLGSALVLGSAVAYALYQILAKPMIDRLGSQLFTSLAMGAAGPPIIAHFLFTQPVEHLALDGYGLLLMLTIGTISTVVPGYCIAAAIGMIGAERTAIIGNISPVVTVGLAIGVLGEVFTPWHAAGTALVLLGVWLFSRKQKPKPAEVVAEVEA